MIETITRRQWKSETPTLNDIDTERTREIGETIAQLEVGDLVKVTNNALDFYLKAYVEEVAHDGSDGYSEVILRFSRHRAELHANWRGIPEDAEDQTTPYTGLLLEPFNDTAPEVTDIEVVGYAEEA